MRKFSFADAFWLVAGLVAILTAPACGSWRGSPKVHVSPDYSACMKSCDPGGACIPKGKGWECLPPAIPVVPAEDGE